MSAFFPALFPVFVCHLYGYSVGDRYKKRLLKAAPSHPLFLLILFVIHLPSALVFIAVTAKVSLTKWFNFSKISANASIFSTWSVDMLYG